MNGRVYDPATAMFLSPDPFVQEPGNWLNYNRYGYCMNNPTNATDPSGYTYHSIESAENIANIMEASSSRYDGFDIGVGSSGGGGSYGSGPGENCNGTGLGSDGVYYDWSTHSYRDKYRRVVFWDMVYWRTIQSYSSYMRVTSCNYAKYNPNNGTSLPWDITTLGVRTYFLDATVENISNSNIEDATGKGIYNIDYAVEWLNKNSYPYFVFNSHKEH